MKNGIRSGLNFFIYSSINIALAAVIFTLEGFYIFKKPIHFNYLGFVFCATLLTYSIHRIVGIQKIGAQFKGGRFKIINDFKSHILFYSIMSLIGTFYFLFKLESDFTLYLFVLGLISGLYTIPIFNNSKRLRDYDYIKIILISFSWAAVATLPFILNISFPLCIIIIYFFEKLLYTFAITLPFDIRDLEIDTHAKVKTFPKTWGIEKTNRIINLCLIICCILACIVSISIIPNKSIVLFVIIAYLITYYAIRYTKGKKSDYYYAGILDGVITLRSIIIILGFILLT